MSEIKKVYYTSKEVGDLLGIQASHVGIIAKKIKCGFVQNHRMRLTEDDISAIRQYRKETKIHYSDRPFYHEITAMLEFGWVV